MRYEVWDVFADAPYAGNQLAVVRTDDLTREEMQAIATEFGYSETTFVPEAPGDGPVPMRIFTPGSEVPFAGHPMIGTALALAGGADRDLVLALGIGEVPVAVRAGRATFEVPGPFRALGEVPPETLAACTGLAAAAFAGPAPHGGVGLDFAFAELADPDALDRAAPVTDAFAAAQRAHPSPLDFALFLYVREGMEVRARMFAPLDGIPEDPATGSACAALQALLAEEAPRLTIRQGEAMGRPSRIETEARGGLVRVSGTAHRVMEGRLLARPG